jgi:hypothetical protein
MARAQDPVSAVPLLANSTGNGTTAATEISPNSIGAGAKAARTLSNLPPPPAGKATLLGGTIQRVDHVRDRLVLEIFGGSRTAVLFDERTRVFRGGQSASLDELKPGERAYVDTTLDGSDVFARDIRIADEAPTGQANGQIVDFRPGTGELIVRDTLDPEPVEMRLAPNAVIKNGERTAQPAELRPGTLVNVAFIPGNSNVPIVRDISILASPGANFVFTGRIEHLDLHRGLLVLIDPRASKSYEVYIDPTDRSITRDLKQGADVTVQASFDGTHYRSRDIAVNPVGAK